MGNFDVLEKKPKEETFDEKREWLTETYPKIVVDTNETTERLFAELPVFNIVSNYSEAVRYAYGFVLLLWRVQRPIGDALESLNTQYLQLLNYVEEDEDRRQYVIRSMDFAGAYLTLWMAGYTYDPIYMETDSVGTNYFALSAQLVGRILEVDVPPVGDTVRHPRSNKWTTHTFDTYHALLSASDQNERDRLLAEAEENWLRQATSREFQNNAGVMGSDNGNLLFVDVYLAAVLHKIGWRDAPTFHKFPQF